jgi:DNA repair protein RecO (recombination protein O)
MREYVVQAVILDREPQRDFDSRVSFFTEKFGKLSGKATSTRKITSKLAGHLEPGNLVHLRFVEKKGLQIVDSLKVRSLKVGVPDLHALNQILAEGEPEPELWQILKGNAFEWNSVLRVLGWDPRGSNCIECQGESAAFYLAHQEIFCLQCSSKLPQAQVIYIYINTSYAAL